MFTRHSFRFFHRPNFLAGIFCIPFIDDIAKWIKSIIALGTVHTIIDRYKMHVMFGEHNFTTMDKDTNRLERAANNERRYAPCKG